MLPLEIWQMILRYSISVPDFLDPNVGDRVPPWILYLQGHWNDPKQYWMSERTRNSLRRVCRSWETYLRLYAHRFVRMDDIIHGLVPAKYLKSAVRISLGDHGPSFCYKCRPNQHPAGGTFQEATSKYSKYCLQIFPQVYPVKAQILDYGKFNSELIGPSILPSAFPELVTVRITSYIDTNLMIHFIESFPSLMHILSQCFWTPDPVVQLKSTILTTLHLSLTGPGRSYENITSQDLDFPKIKNLRIWFPHRDESSGFKPRYWLDVLGLVGRNSRTLYLNQQKVLCTHQGPCGDISGDIWTICPKVEHLHLSGQVTSSPPPPGHPIHTLSIPYSIVRAAHPLYNHVPDWPGLRTIQVDEVWNRPLLSSQLERIEPSLRLEDITGESYPDYLGRIGSGTK
jgi:hypothetical protein